jgi:hypothetical protein
VESEEGTGPVAHAPVAATTTVSIPPAGPSAPAIFGALVAVLVLSVGASALLLAGAGRTVVAEPTVISAVPTNAARATSAAGPEAPSDRVRVVSASGRSTSTGAGSHRVTFTWSLQGARESDQAVVHFFVGNQFLGEQRGTLDASVFSFSSGSLTLTTEQECSPSGWSAEIVTIRGAPVDGDSIATVPGVACP